ncbi:MAG: zinc-ribbon domain-containing protein [Candidatus Lokiarchaeota archaeon]|nr:zinc-ribbon domain-containing protein [Candidatus Lokiarchaeota archaeon]
MSPPTLIGGILLLVTVVFFPIAEFDLRVGYDTDFILPTLISMLMHPRLMASDGSNYIYVNVYLLFISEALFVLAGIFGVVGGGAQKKGLKVASGVLGLVGGGVTILLIVLFTVTIPSMAYSVGITNYNFSVTPYYGLYMAFAGGVLSLTGLAVKEDEGIYTPPSPQRYPGATSTAYTPRYSASTTSASIPRTEASWDISSQTVPAVAPPTAMSDEQTSFGKRFCAGCGAQLPPDSTFCPNCGHRLD